ncbi:MAG: hypothetical protein Q9M44_06420, partial [Ghiorsea sp.]|nr:hypothetical protein [Ghiorsea sp.]
AVPLGILTAGTSLCDPTLAQHGAFDALSAGVIYAANTQLDAPQAAAGSLPISVVTDANGIANFDLTYLKASAAWIDAQVRVKTQVLGTESSSSITFTLPYALGEGTAGSLPSSSFGQ